MTTTMKTASDRQACNCAECLFGSTQSREESRSHVILLPLGAYVFAPKCVLVSLPEPCSK